MTREETIDLLLERSRSPRHRGRLEAPDAVASGGHLECGDVVTFFLRTEPDGERIQAVSFEGEGCIISQAAASLLSETVENATLTEIEAMGYPEMIDALGREVVQGRPRCATLALGTLKAAVTKLRGQSGGAAARS
ncbi:MAG: iron-sulfur cluster assembly scaffold protein [Acidobacteria bacterium]|nr:iron-sulfur cluster assembly scaffold protein [Acidobacteriota bacterium]